MGILIEKTRPLLKRVSWFLGRRIEYLRERLEAFLGVYRVNAEHIYTQEENELIEGSIEVVKQFFPEDPGRMLLEEDFESRCQVLEDLAARLVQLYRLTGVEVIVTDDPEIFPEEEVHTFGITVMREKKVYLNAHYLQADNEQILEHLVSTVIHELRHVMQFEIMTLENTRGVPYQRRKAWRYNVGNYVSAEQDMQGYTEQPVEFDARNFASRVWRGAYQRAVR